jgi:hypothetical protein
MIVRKRILGIRKQSRISIPKQDLWFFSEGSAIAQEPVRRRKSNRKDRFSNLNQDYDRYSLENSKQDRIRQETLFIVDWQISDEI